MYELNPHVFPVYCRMYVVGGKHTFETAGSGLRDPGVTI